jgi:hypothetical protein
MDRIVSDFAAGRVAVTGTLTLMAGTALLLGFASYLLGTGLMPDGSRIGFSRGDLKFKAVMKNVGVAFLVLAGVLGLFAYLSISRITIQDKDGRTMKVEQGPHGPR